MNDYRDYFLAHHGILGMKWGVRRYRNKDGSLTPLGRARYKNPNNAFNDISNQIAAAKVKHSPAHPLLKWTSKYLSDIAIGEKSKKVIDDYERKDNNYRDSKRYKKWLANYQKTIDKAYLDYLNEEITSEQYNSIERKLLSKKPKPGKDEYDISRFHYTNGNGIGGIVDEYGKDLTLAYIQDLGYPKDEAVWLTKTILKTNKTLH